tara:strand:- start:2936 stop:4243 length:1308 start_codon:yes stop_codon:yes gene_type:complete
VIQNMFRKAMASDDATLSLDFTTGALDSRLTFTRSTTGTYINSSGYVTSAAINAPRFDYDPTTPTARGLLIEGAASNLMFRSQAINTSPWFNAGTMTISETGSSSPANDATSNVVTWTNGTGSGNAWLQQTVAVSAGSLVVGTAYTWSIWLKSRGGRRVNVFAVLQGVSGNREVRVDFGVSPPTVTSTVATGWTSIQTPTIVEYPNGWYKITTGGTLPASTTSVAFGLSNSDAVPASGTNGFEAWGYQLEAGSGASSYIPTGASTGSRAVDTAIIAAGTAFSGWYTGGLNGTFYADWYGGVAGASGTQRSVLATDDVTTKHLHLYQTATTNTMTLANFGGGSTLATSNAISPAGSRSKAAFSYATSAMNICLNGGTVASGTVTGFTVAPTWLSLGAPSTNGTSITGTTVVLNNSIRSIKYWPTVLSNAQLQALTT